MKIQSMTFGEMCGDGLFKDGDWIESKDQDPNGEVRIIQLADIGIGKFLDMSSRFMTLEKTRDLNCTYLQEGDILIARMPDPIGRACILPAMNQVCVTAVDVCIVRIETDEVDSRWLMHKINSSGFNHQIMQFVTGTTRKRISRGNLSRLVIDIPPIDEQKRIAAILDKAEEINITSVQVYQTRNYFLNSVFSDLFGDILTGHSACEYATLNDCTQFIDYRGQSPPKSPHGIRLITAKNVKHGHLNYHPVEFIDEAQYETWMTRGFPELGDVLFTTEAPMGNAALWPDSEEKIAIAQRTICIRLDERIKPEYFLWLILSDWFKLKMNRLATGSTVKGIKSSSLKKIEIPIPPLELQVQFGLIYNHYNSTNSKFEIRLSQSKQNILSTTQEMLT